MLGKPSVKVYLANKISNLVSWQAKNYFVSGKRIVVSDLHVQKCLVDVK